MCGICGFTGAKESHTLHAMTDALMHRGPDEEGFYSDGRINLGIRRLSIIDIKTGHQPIHNEDKTICVICNGEIYNFQELRNTLEKKGHAFATHHSDTEVIVHLYEEYGESFVHNINGMFAIALWDTTKNTLYLIRDRMGVKPLYYAVINGNIVFGSEIKALLCYPQYKREMDYDAMYHYFTFKHVPAPLTAFKGIAALLPGEMLSFDRSGIRKKKWWRIVFREDAEINESSAQTTILNLLNDATKIRMVSDVPLGAYLSGGVDSSSVVALMARHSAHPVKTFCLGYEDDLEHKEQDIKSARKVADILGTDHHEYIMSHTELLKDMKDVIGAFDQPFSGTISTYFLSKLIKKYVKVALSGDGADELFGSYLSHRTAQPMYHYRLMRDHGAGEALTRDEQKKLLPCDISFLEDLYKKSNGDEAAWRYHLYLISDEEKESLLSPAFHAQRNGSGTFSLVRQYFKGLSATDPLNRILEMEWNTQLPDQVLAFVDFLSMAHSVEIRSPFLDYRLVEFAATVPGQWKIHEGTVKNILKQSVRDILPAGIIQRSKEGFVLPVFEWIMKYSDGFWYEIISPEKLEKHKFFNPDTVRTMLRSCRDGDAGSLGILWNIMMFQVWWEKYFN